MRSFLQLTLLAMLLDLAHAAPATAHVAWPDWVRVTSASGGPVAFHAVVVDGAVLAVERARGTEWWRPMGAISTVTPLAAGDTARDTTPAAFPLDLARGAVVFAATGREALHVTVWQGGRDAHSATGSGRRLTLRRAGRRLEVRSD